MDVETANDAKGGRSDDHFTAQKDRKMGLVVEPTICSQRGNAEEIEATRKTDRPLAWTEAGIGSCGRVSGTRMGKCTAPYLNLQAGVEFNHLQNRDITTHIEEEGLGSVLDAGGLERHRGIGGVNHEATHGIDLDEPSDGCID